MPRPGVGSCYMPNHVNRSEGRPDYLASHNNDGEPQRRDELKSVRMNGSTEIRFQRSLMELPLTWLAAGDAIATKLSISNGLRLRRAMTVRPGRPRRWIVATDKKMFRAPLWQGWQQQ